MSIIHRIYNKIHNFVFRVPVEMQPGRELNVDVKRLNEIDNKYGDWLIHPCVRYIPEGLGGHKWWMVVTPYPNYNSKYENPILYYGDSNDTTPPLNWNLVGIVQGTYDKGYNADCNLHYDGKKLWIFWKESDTANTTPESGYKNMMGRSYDGKAFGPVKNFCDNPDNKSMYLAAPVVYNIHGKIKCLGVYSPNMGDNIPGVDKKPRSIAVFGIDGNLSDYRFEFESIVPQKYRIGFDFWHIDIFDYKGKYYSLVTPESGTEILLGESENGISYNYFDKPLLHSNGIKRVPYMYKASGVVIDGIFHLFYPSKLKDKKKVHIFCSSIEFEKLLKKLSK